MLMDARTWTTLAYLIVMLPLGILYFVIAVVGLSLGLSFTAAPIVDIAQRLGLLDGRVSVYGPAMPGWIASPVGDVLLFVLGLLVVTLLMHTARGIVRMHARMAKSLLAKPA